MMCSFKDTETVCMTSKGLAVVNSYVELMHGENGIC